MVVGAPVINSFDHSSYSIRHLGFPSEDFLISIGKRALGPNKPFQDTVCSPLHKIYYEGHLQEAKSLLRKVSGVSRIPYKNEKLYNVQLDNYSHMIVNGIKVETLHPKNRWAKKN